MYGAPLPSLELNQSKTVAQFSRNLAEVPEDALLENLKTADFKGVYLDDFWKRRDEEAKSYLLENFRELRTFAGHCASHGQSAVIQFT